MSLSANQPQTSTPVRPDAPAIEGMSNDNLPQFIPLPSSPKKGAGLGFLASAQRLLNHAPIGNLSPSYLYNKFSPVTSTKPPNSIETPKRRTAALNLTNHELSLPFDPTPIQESTKNETLDFQAMGDNNVSNFESSLQIYREQKLKERKTSQELFDKKKQELALKRDREYNQLEEEQMQELYNELEAVRASKDKFINELYKEQVKNKKLTEKWLLEKLNYQRTSKDLAKVKDERDLWRNIFCSVTVGFVCIAGIFIWRGKFEGSLNLGGRCK